MSKRILTCPSTTLNFVRYLSGEMRRSSQVLDSGLAKILDLIKSKTVELYTPVYMIPFIHQYLDLNKIEQTGESCWMGEFLKLSCSNLSIDYDILLNDSLKLTKMDASLELWQAMSLLTAQSLQVDFLIISDSSLHQLLDHHPEFSSNFSIPYGTAEQFLSNCIN